MLVESRERTEREMKKNKKLIKKKQEKNKRLYKLPTLFNTRTC